MPREHDHGRGHGAEEKIDRILALLKQSLILLKRISQKEDSIMADLTALTAQVTENGDVEASAIVLIQNIAAQLAAAGTDPAALAALQTKLKTSADALAAAVVANTPAA